MPGWCQAVPETKPPGRGTNPTQGPSAARWTSRELPVRLADVDSRHSHWKLEKISATLLRRSENWPKWLVGSAKSCIMREPLPWQFTDHLGKGSVWPVQECKPPGTLFGQGLLSCIERVRAWPRRRWPSRTKKAKATRTEGNTEDTPRLL